MPGHLEPFPSYVRMDPILCVALVSLIVPGHLEPFPSYVRMESYPLCSLSESNSDHEHLRNQAQHSTAQRSAARHGTAQHGTASVKTNQISGSEEVSIKRKPSICITNCGTLVHVNSVCVDDHRHHNQCSAIIDHGHY